jgi:hypothetical protein
MSNDNFASKDDLLIGRNHWDVPVRVELPAYLRFSRRLDQQLRRLVAHWQHTASPAAREPTSRMDDGI